VGLDAVSVRQLGFRAGLRLDVAAGFVEQLVCDSSGCESAEALSSAETPVARPVDGDGGTRPHGKSGHGSAAPPDHQSRLRQLRSAARIGAPPRSPLENDDADFSSRRGLDGSASFGNATGDRLRYEFNKRRDFYRDSFDGIAARIGRAVVVASSLKQKLCLKKAVKKNGRPFFFIALSIFTQR
jgi:hypothetical protein